MTGEQGTLAPRLPLSRMRILEAALALVDGAGLAGLSMRGLARNLGFEAMSLYKHVHGKDDIVGGIVEIVIEEIDLPPSSMSWDAALRTCALSAHDALLRHPWACSLVMAPTGGAPAPGARLRYIEWMLGVLREAGFSDALVFHGYHALDSHILGYTLWQLGHTAGPGDLDQLAAELLEQLPRGDFPNLVQHVEAHLHEPADSEPTGFEFGLEFILDGLRRSLDR